LGTLGKVPPILDRLDLVFVKQSVKPGLDHSPDHFVNWPLAGLIGIVQIPLRHLLSFFKFNGLVATNSHLFRINQITAQNPLEVQIIAKKKRQ
jgi:hypothetical protein